LACAPAAPDGGSRPPVWGVTYPSGGMDRSSTARARALASARVSEAAQPLPGGTILLHIGPHKTGTSSVQSAFHVARRSIAPYSVRYAGPNRHPVRAAQAAIARGAAGTPAAARPIRPWRNLVRRIDGDLDRDPATRVVLSSEWFADATPEAARRIVDELGPQRTHVVITLRPLATLLPSQWQQYVQAGMTRAYGPWLSDVLADPPAHAAAGFWRRHRHDELIARWSAIVSPGAVTAIVVDDRDHGSVLRAFEKLLGLPVGILAAEDARTNRSLTSPEAELVRALNARLRSEELDPTVGLNLGLYGVAAGLRAWRSGADDPRIGTPSWATARIRALAGDIANGVRESGVNVVGDIDRLATMPAAPGSRDRAGRDPAPDARLDRDGWARLAATGALGALAGAGLVRAAPGEAGLDVVSTSRLGEVLVGRLRDTLLAPLAALVAPSRRLAQTAPDRRAPRRGRAAVELDATTGPALEAGSLDEAILDALDLTLRGHDVPIATRDRALTWAASAMRGLSAPVAGAPEGETAAGGAEPAPELGAAAILGVIRSTGLGSPSRGPAAVRRLIVSGWRRRTGETLELARVQTSTLARHLASRFVRRQVGRLRGR
jgi:hypothetical protein